jgi:hypothetical protein
MENENLNEPQNPTLSKGVVMPRELSLHNYWDSNTSEDRLEIVERAFNMIEKQKEYIAVLNKEIKYYLTKINSQWILVSDEIPKMADLIITPNHQLDIITAATQFRSDYKIEDCLKVISQQPILTSLSEEEQKIIGFVDVEKLWDSQPKLYEVECEMEIPLDEETIRQPKITKEGVKILKLK